ncbi:hypothetical protein Q6272_33320, partial [Klebsiella pneumoniae]|nr:hypothetical protein [Klebsiella pneumoniae]
LFNLIKSCFGPCYFWGMANKVRTLFEIEATLGEVNFYRKDGELRVRRVGRVSGQRIRTEKAFQRTRENNAEFKMAAHA